MQISESPNIIDFAKQLRLEGDEIDRLVEILYAIVNEDQQTLAIYRLMPNEVRPIKMYAEKLIETGFLKPYMSRHQF
uniref:Uncharacterized protein n=1 Tax=Romanomermis culicivorax TaxID=13658 RepID=A0A915IZ17_ROMCU